MNATKGVGWHVSEGGADEDRLEGKRHTHLFELLVPRPLLAAYPSHTGHIQSIKKHAGERVRREIDGENGSVSFFLSADHWYMARAER